MVHVVYMCMLPICILAFKFAATLLPPFSLEAMPELSNARFNCVCIRHGFGQPHIISSTTFFIMHLAGNLTDLLISLWHGTIVTGPDDDKLTWDWAVLHDPVVWGKHGQLVEHAGHYLPGSFDRKLCNITEKINTQYKTWEFHLYLFGYAPIFLYLLLPSKYWSNFCKLVCGFQIMCQHTITSRHLQEAHTMLCSLEQEFELCTYFTTNSSKVDSISFVLLFIKFFTSSLRPSRKAPPYVMLSGQWSR